MKNMELVALGLNKEQIRAVQRIHWEDIERERSQPDVKSKHFISALAAVCRLLQPEALHELLLHATALYNQQTPTPAQGTDAAELAAAGIDPADPGQAKGTAAVED